MGARECGETESVENARDEEDEDREAEREATRLATRRVCSGQNDIENKRIKGYISIDN